MKNVCISLLTIKGNIPLLSSAQNFFKDDFTTNCQQSFCTSCWSTVIIQIIENKIFGLNENTGDFILNFNGVFKHVPFAGLWSLSPGSDTSPTERLADPEWSCTASGVPLLSHWGKKTYRQNITSKPITWRSHWSGINYFLQIICLLRPNLKICIFKTKMPQKWTISVLKIFILFLVIDTILNTFQNL